MHSKISITTTSIPIPITTPVHTGTLPPYSVHRPSRYTLNNPKSSLYSSIQLACCLLIVFHHENITEDQILLVKHIIWLVSKFKYRRKPKKSMTELSWSVLEWMSIDLVVLTGGCGVSLQNKDWKGPKIDLQELYHQVVEKVVYDLLKSRNSGDSIIWNLKETLEVVVGYLRGVDWDILKTDLGWFMSRMGMNGKSLRIVDMKVEMWVEVTVAEKAVEAREERAELVMVGGMGEEAWWAEEMDMRGAEKEAWWMRC